LKIYSESGKIFSRKTRPCRKRSQDFLATLTHMARNKKKMVGTKMITIWVRAPKETTLQLI
jgi:hypothetical protein